MNYGGNTVSQEYQQESLMKEVEDSSNNEA